jgi:putative tricarboxylic transport membrane protein
MSGTLFAAMALVIIVSMVAGFRRKRRLRSRPATPGEEDLAEAGMRAEPEGSPGAESVDRDAPTPGPGGGRDRG